MACMHLVLTIVNILMDWRIRSVHGNVDAHFESICLGPGDEKKGTVKEVSERCTNENYIVCGKNMILITAQ